MHTIQEEKVQAPLVEPHFAKWPLASRDILYSERFGTRKDVTLLRIPQDLVNLRFSNLTATLSRFHCVQGALLHLLPETSC